jgi:integrase
VDPFEDAAKDPVEELAAARAAALALAAEVFAVRPATTRYGPRHVAAATVNLRLAVLSSFYEYATRHDLLRGTNPIARVKRRRVTAYAGAHPIANDALRTALAAIDVGADDGLRDYALLVVALTTGHRVAELAAMRLEHLRIGERTVVIDWPRCKGGKQMQSVLPRGGVRGEAADALVAWMLCLARWQQERQGDADAARRAVVPAPAQMPAPPPERPVWVSLSDNGTAGHPLTPRTLSRICARRVGTSKVHALRHTFARTMEDANAKVSEIQAALGHADLGTTGRYLAQLHQGENRHLGALSSRYGLTGFAERLGAQSAPMTATGSAPEGGTGRQEGTDAPQHDAPPVSRQSTRSEAE